MSALAVVKLLYHVFHDSLYVPVNLDDSNKMNAIKLLNDTIHSLKNIKKYTHTIIKNLKSHKKMDV